MENLCKKLLSTGDLRSYIRILDKETLKIIRESLKIGIIYNADFEKNNSENKNKHVIHEILSELLSFNFINEEWVPVPDKYMAMSESWELWFNQRVKTVLQWLGGLKIEPLSEKTSEGLWRITQERTTMANIGKGTIWSREDIDRKIHQVYNFVVTYNDAVVGYIGLHPYLNLGLQLRVFIGNSHKRKGYADKAIKLLLESVKPSQDIYAVVKRSNVASNNLIKKSGFIFMKSSNIYGHIHNIYKVFPNKYDDVFFIPKNSNPKDLDYSFLEHKLEKDIWLTSLEHIKSDYPSFVWIGGYPKPRHMYSKQALIKNALDGHSTITDKLNLYVNMLNIDTRSAEQYMAYTAELVAYRDEIVPVGVLSGRAVKLDHSKYYIVRPVGGFSGKGVTVIDNLSKINSAYAIAKGGAPPESRVIISEYIKDVMTYHGKKFHIRVYLLCLLKTGVFSTFLWKNGDVMTAHSQYDPLKIDKTVSDTHSKSTVGDISLLDLKLDSFSTGLFGGVELIMKRVSEIYASSVLNFEENKYGFEVFAADILITNDYTPVLMEVNDRVGYSFNTEKYAKSFSRDYFDWIDGCVLSRVFQSSRPISPIYEIDLTINSPPDTYNKPFKPAYIPRSSPYDPLTP